jgi:hypothetical protein
MGMTTDVYAVSPSDAARLLADRDFVRRCIANDSVLEHVSLEKAWHGLHYLLTGDASLESVPLAFIVPGGNEVPGSDAGYGAARIFSPAETAEINAALSDIDDEALWSSFDADAMTEQGVYPVIWDEPEEDLKEEYLFYFHDLKKLVAAAASRGESVLVFLT